ncbi:YybH family protein [Segetibacter koreensis]|uniref:YybH family protein n=1 Tax=Segetibacter koreensis TaxID=398037 RepID=UPI00036DDB41|nr:nuclear transport factor 2 family protein [Segetibacter koreensis]
MYKLISFLLLVFVLQNLLAQTNKDKDIEQIKAARKASNEAIQKHDLAGIAHPMIEDMVCIFGNGHTYIGKDSTISILKQRFDTMPDLVFVRNPFVIRISNNDTLAWEKGTWKGFRTDRKIRSSSGGNYAAMWCKRNGVWKTRSELFVALTSNYPF